MKTARYLLAITLAAAFGAAAQTPSDADARYVERIDARYSVFAGSHSNLESLALGLRRGTSITLSGSGETAILQPPTRPMGYGNVTRSLDLASRQLAALGITEPTPKEISAALNGGTVSTSTGEVTLQGVLQLRSEGMGWGQIAHAVGVHPGMGSAKGLPVSATAGSSGITTAAGGSVARPGAGTGNGRKEAPSAARGGAVTNAGGTAVTSSNISASGAKSQGTAHAYGKASGRL